MNYGQQSVESIFIFQVDKVVQMYETMLTRHTTMVVGPTGGGKSVVINALCRAQNKCVWNLIHGNQVVKWHRLHYLALCSHDRIHS